MKQFVSPQRTTLPCESRTSPLSTLILCLVTWLSSCNDPAPGRQVKSKQIGDISGDVIDIGGIEKLNYGGKSQEDNPFAFKYTFQVTNPESIPEILFAGSILTLTCNRTEQFTLEISKSIVFPGFRSCEIGGFSLGNDAEYKPFQTDTNSKDSRLFTNGLGILQVKFAKIEAQTNEVVVRATVTAGVFNSLVDRPPNNSAIKIAANFEVNTENKGAVLDLSPGQSFNVVLTGKNRREITSSMVFAFYVDLVTSPPRSITWINSVTSSGLSESRQPFPVKGTLFNTGGFVSSLDNSSTINLTGTLSQDAGVGSTVYIDLMRSSSLKEMLPNLLWGSNEPQNVVTDRSLKIRVIANGN
jgi:hypothetical protein